MPVIARIALAAAAVLVAVAVGINLLPQGGGVAAPGPSPTPSITPVPTIAASPVAYAWSGPIAAGTYTTDFAFDLPIAMTFTVPDGWEGRDVNVLRPDRVSLAFLSVPNVYADTCSGQLRDPAIDPGVDGLADALASMPGLDATSPAPASLGGFDGKYLEYTPVPDGACALELLRIMELGDLVCDAGCTAVGSGDLGVEFPIEGATNRTWVLDSGGRGRIVIQAASVPDATPAELDELQSVIDSITFVRTVPATQPPAPG